METTILVTCFLGILFALAAPSSALPFNIRITVENGNHLTATVATGIVIAICKLIHFIKMFIALIFS